MTNNFIFGEPNYTLPVVDYNITKETFKKVVSNKINETKLPSVSVLLMKYKTFGEYIIKVKRNNVSKTFFVEMNDGKSFYFNTGNNPEDVKYFLIKISDYDETAYNDYAVYFGRDSMKEQFEL